MSMQEQNLNAEIQNNGVNTKTLLGDAMKPADLCDNLQDYELKSRQDDEQDEISDIVSSDFNDIVTKQPEDILKNLKKRFFRKVTNINGLMDELRENIKNEVKPELLISKLNLENLYNDLRTIYEKLSNEFNFEEMEEIEKKYEDVQKLYFKLIKDIVKHINDIEEEKDLITMQLEKTEIPIFTGDINDWFSFNDLYKNLIHDCKSLSKAEKMFRLKLYLSGEAAQLINPLNDYDAAWNMLKEKYENRRILFTTAIDKLLDQPTVNIKSADSIKKLLDISNECVQTFKNLEINLEEAEPFIARIIVKKLDKDSIKVYEGTVKRTSNIQKLKDVFEFLEDQ